MRFSGTALGLACALLAMFFGLPSIQTVGGLLTVSAPVFFAAAWIQRSTRYTLAGIYCAVTYSVVALALPTDQPDLLAALSRVRGLVLAIAIVFLVGSVLWPSYARAGRSAAFARILAPLAAATKRPSMNTPVRGLSAAARSRHWVAETVAGTAGCADRETSKDQNVGGVEAEMISQTSRPTLRNRCGVSLEK